MVKLYYKNNLKKVFIIMLRVKEFIKKETVLVVSGILAIISCFFVPVSKKYLSYIDVKTIILLFCLMLVMAGFQKIGVFNNIAGYFLKKIKYIRGLVLILISLCFFGSMIITNDVALITFVPFAILILKMANLEYLTCLTIVLMTISANLGSMLTPIGNPQNLYLFTLSKITIYQFIAITIPYVILSGILLFLCLLLYKRRNIESDIKTDIVEVDKKKMYIFCTLFLFCLMSVLGFINDMILFFIVLTAMLFVDRKLILNIDYSLLLTFIFFFVFIGNMGQIESFNEVIKSSIEQKERILSIGISQVISNVPCALLLSGFSDNFKELIIGTNLGGLGTLIASMASLISYKQIVLEYETLKVKYLVLFTIFNIGFLSVLLVFSYIIN